MSKLAIALTLSLCFVSTTVAGDETSRSQTNFVFFLVDDLGWADLGCFGSTFHETPHIDALADSGMKFTCAYAASPVCSPTRASIMTGRHPVRVDITDWIPGRRRKQESNPKFAHVNDRDNLALDETTIAEILRDNGYQTFFAGKWHLGGNGHLPTDQGFEFNLGGFDRGSPPGGYYSPYKNPLLPDREKGEYLTERLTEESISFLQSREKDKPFLLYLSYYNVHTPIQPYKKRIDHFRENAKTKFTGESKPVAERDGSSRTRQDNPAYASMVAAVDDSVGAILSQLDELGLSENTVVIFFSDNGGLCTLQNKRIGPTCNAPLRSGKGWLYEGGIRCPMIVRAPQVTASGAVCDTPVMSTDFFPTILELAGLESKPDLHVDGVSLVELMEGATSTDRETLYWHYPHYHGSAWKPGAAIREGDWKLIEFYEYDEVELYNLKDDIGEQSNLAESNKQKTNALRTKLKKWQSTMNARMPIASDVEELNGDWSLNLKSGTPAWMSIRDLGSDPQIKLRLHVGPDGPQKDIAWKDGRLRFTLRQNNKATDVKTVDVGIVDGKLDGVIVSTAKDGTSTEDPFTGKKIPRISATPPDLSKVLFGEPISLFNGKDLTGWRPHESGKINGWSVKDRVLVNTTPKTDFSATGAYANLSTEEVFEDFRLHIEFLVEKDRNSGVYLRGMYEAQVVDRDSRMQGIQGVGAIFGMITPSENAGKPGGQWQSYDLTLVDRHITVVLNGVKVIDNQPVPAPTAGAVFTDPTAPGPIHLQGDHTNVKYRNIYLEPAIKDQ